MDKNTPDIKTKPLSVLFVCGMNAIRSPMAEALMRQLFPQIYVASAGLIKGERDSFADTVIAEAGLSLHAHAPCELQDLTDGFFDLIITLTPKAHEAVLKAMRGYSSEVEFWLIADPALVEGSREQIIQAYRDVRETLKSKIIARFSQ